MLAYNFQIYEWPVFLLRKTETWCRNFLSFGYFDEWGVPWLYGVNVVNLWWKGGLGLNN